MAIYQEDVTKWYKAALFMVVAFLIIYSPWWFADRELLWNEGEFAAIVQEMDIFFPVSIAHGEIVNGFPLFPMIATVLCKYLGWSIEFVLRFISVASLGLITILVWEAGRRALNLQAAYVSSAAVFSALVVVEKTIDGYPSLLAFVFIFTGWLIWFSYGVARSCWNRAWIYSMFFCGLAFYTLGWEAVIYFFFPMIFLRRPMTIWQKLRKPGFFAGLGIIVFFILAWGLPRWSGLVNAPFRISSPNADLFDEYIKQLFTFPFSSMLRFLPWMILAWTPFCIAYQPMDKNPLFSRFLRTIFISLFMLLWLSPFTRARDLLILAPPISLLCGVNYWLFVRRNGFHIQKLLKILSFIGLILGAAILVFYLLPADFIQKFNRNDIPLEFRWNRLYIIAGVIQGALMVLISAFVLFRMKRDLKIWEHILLICVTGMLFYWALLSPYKGQDTAKRELGEAFRIAMGSAFDKDMTIYKDKKINGLYGETYYIGCNVKKIHSYDELPTNKRMVYLISTDVPVFPGRLWTNLLPETKTYKDNRICLWKGEKVEKSIKK